MGRSVIYCVTGATGTLGQAITRRLLTNPDVEQIRCFSRDELKQHDMRRAFDDDPRLRFLLGDVRDADRLMRALDGVTHVIHCAALKQVPALEYNPIEAVKTNILGAANIIEAAIDRGVRRVIGISTDKACNPINAYGASKLMLEKLLIAGNHYSGKHQTRFAVMRYGNVANSRGSVIPLWQQAHDTISLTDPRMTRFFWTITQAVTFVLACLERMQGGECFVPKLPSTRMLDVAKAVAPDCRIEITGIRPGEKLAESMIGPDEPRLDCGDYYVVGQGQTGPAYDSASNDRWLSVEEIRGALSLS